jgi:hypothetical protein
MSKFDLDASEGSGCSFVLLASSSGGGENFLNVRNETVKDPAS